MMVTMMMLQQESCKLWWFFEDVDGGDGSGGEMWTPWKGRQIGKQTWLQTYFSNINKTRNEVVHQRQTSTTFSKTMSSQSFAQSPKLNDMFGFFSKQCTNDKNWLMIKSWKITSFYCVWLSISSSSQSGLFPHFIAYQRWSSPSLHLLPHSHFLVVDNCDDQFLLTKRAFLQYDF